jgi:hypothetical protein
MTGQRPRFRQHVRKRKGGRVVVYYTYDMRGTGKPDVPLGTDFDPAVKKWDELHNRAPRVAGTIQEAIDRYRNDILPGLNKQTANDYTKYLRHIEKPFGPATWDMVDMPTLVAYLNKRKGKTQANRELAMLSIIWHKAILWGYTKLLWPAHGLKHSKWKNPEKATKLPPQAGEAWDAIYAVADQTLKDCMDLGTATGMRLTDCCAVILPRDNVLHLDANKTGKEADFDLDLSTVLPALIARRRTYPANHLMLLSTPGGHQVSLRMLRDRWDAARAAAAIAHPELAASIKRMWLRFARKLAANAVASDAEAAELLQHGDVRTTRQHYRSVVAKLRPTR